MEINIEKSEGEGRFILVKILLTLACNTEQLQHKLGFEILGIH